MDATVETVDAEDWEEDDDLLLFVLPLLWLAFLWLFFHIGEGCRHALSIPSLGAMMGKDRRDGLKQILLAILQVEFLILKLLLLAGMIALSLSLVAF